MLSWLREKKNKMMFKKSHAVYFTSEERDELLDIANRLTTIEGYFSQYEAIISVEDNSKSYTKKDIERVKDFLRTLANEDGWENYEVTDDSR